MSGICPVAQETTLGHDLEHELGRDLEHELGRNLADDLGQDDVGRYLHPGTRDRAVTSIRTYPDGPALSVPRSAETMALHVDPGLAPDMPDI